MAWHICMRARARAHMHRCHPRHGHALFDAPRPNQTFVNQTAVLGKLDEATAVPNGLRKMFETLLPKMRGFEGEAYRGRLAADREAQSVLASYERELSVWSDKLRSSLVAARADPLEHWSRALEAKKCLGSVSVPITDRHGVQKTHRATLTPEQARMCFLEAQSNAQALALNRPVSLFDTQILMEVCMHARPCIHACTSIHACMHIHACTHAHPCILYVEDHI